MALITLLIGFSTSSYSSSNAGLNLSELNLVTRDISDGCADLNGQIYSHRTTLISHNKGYYYAVRCSSQGHNMYKWEVSLVKQSLYSNKVSTDGLGCRDKEERIYDEGYILTERFDNTLFSFKCNFKKEKHYFSIQ